MKIPALILALACLTLNAAAPTWPLPATATALLEDEEAFAAFARSVGSGLEPLLAAQPDPATLQMLLAIRVHLALHTGDDARALDSAARIRALLPDDATKAYAGLTTQAFVAARQRTGVRPGDPAFGPVFAREFAARLTTLPSSAAMRVVLEQQRGKFTAMTAESLRREFAGLAAALDGRATCTLAEADQLVRLRHRFADLLPVRAQLLEVLGRAIAARKPD